jgi:hypothetical protein
MDMDPDVNNYTIQELLSILEINNEEEEDDDEDDKSNSNSIYNKVLNKTNYYIKKFDNEEKIDLSIFFQNIQNRLLPYFYEINRSESQVLETQSGNQDNSYKNQTLDWFQNEALKQTDETQNSKITDRKQKIDVYKNIHVPMNREQLGVNNNFNVAVAQDTLNPNLKNITSRFINLDSQFRQATSGTESSSTDYTLDLSEHLTNVLSLRLYSVQIPVTWYAIDFTYGNTCFWINIIDSSDNNIANIPISIEPGNYNPTDFVSILNTGSVDVGGNSNFKSSCFQDCSSIVTQTYPISYNKNTGKIMMNFTGIIYRTDMKQYPLTTNTTKITFFDIYNILQCDTLYCNNQANTIDQTLGWLMGYRTPYINIDVSGNANAVAVLDLYGPKYLILALDDYNQNHINNGLISITELSTNVKLPSYYNPKLPISCIPLNIQENNLENNMENGNNTNGDMLIEKLDLLYKKIPQVISSNPRVLTQSQIYTINQIIKNNGKNTNFRTKAPTVSDTFALIPLKISNNTTGNMYVEFGGTLQDNKRNYFGPVNIERMRVKLLDDKGNVINLNGADWSCTIISENLYQY